MIAYQLKGSAKMSVEEKKKYVRQLFKGYKKMTHSLQKELKAIGIRVEYGKKHIKLFYNDKLFICSCSGSDYRSGMNLASAICRVIKNESYKKKYS